MPLVEGIRGPDPVRYCDICETHTLQLVASYVGYDEDGNVTREPVVFSHLGPHCPVCADKIARGETCNAYAEYGTPCPQPFGHEGNHGERDSFGSGLDGIRRESAAA